MQPTGRTNRLHRVSKLLEGFAERVQPLGAYAPLARIEIPMVLTREEVENAIALWDKALPSYAGMLDAEVVGSPLGAELGEAGKPQAPWRWDEALKRYRHPKTGRFLGADQMVRLRDRFVNYQKRMVAALAKQLAGGKISVQEWEVAMRGQIKATMVDEYILGRGGRKAMTRADWGHVGAEVNKQYSFLHNFARDAASGRLTEAQIRNRAQMYMEAGTGAFEKGKAAAHGLPRLPAYPGDGTTRCRTMCRCTWRVVETADGWECSWTLNRAAEHCMDCMERARLWSPLVIPRIGVGRGEPKGRRR